MAYTPKFDAAIKIVLLHEGGYVNHPNDPGGETKYGIAKRSYPRVDIRNLTEAGAKDIYYRDWWAPGPYESISDQPLAMKVFDTAINMGTKRAYRMLQEAANTLGANLVVDGIVGKQTIRSVNSLPAQKVLEAFRKLQEAYYMGLIAKRPSLGVFKNGWIKRARS